MNYIDSNTIVDDVKNSLSSYFSSNKVDESILPRVIRRCVGQMGLKIRPVKSTVLELHKFKADLPEDFNKVTMAMLCTGRAKYVRNPLKWEAEQKIVTELNLCETACSVCTDDCGRMTKIIQKTEWDLYEYDEFTVLKPSPSSRPYCDNGCFNLRSNSSYGFEVKEQGNKKVLMTTEQDGLLYIEYLSELEGEDGFMVPDNEAVKTWIYNELRKECFKYMWDNGEDVMQRMQHAEREVVIWEERARQVYQRNEVSDYYNMAQRLLNRYNAMEAWMSPTTSVYRARN